MTDLHSMPGGVPDLGAINARNRAKKQTPSYEVGEPEIVQSVGIEVQPGEPPSFKDALDRVARNLGIDGWEITEVVQVALMQVAEHEGRIMAGFQVSVKAKRNEPAPDVGAAVS